MLGIWQTSSSCGKINNIKGVCTNTPEQDMQAAQNTKMIHELQQRDEENWHNAGDINDRHRDAINVKSLRFNSIRSVIITKLEKKTAGKREQNWSTRQTQVVMVT